MHRSSYIEDASRPQQIEEARDTKFTAQREPRNVGKSNQQRPARLGKRMRNLSATVHPAVDEDLDAIPDS